LALRAQPVETSNASFEERFLLGHQAGPTFTRPEVQQLLSSLGTSVVAPESLASPEPRSRSEIAFSEPKGPAKMLKEFLTMPVKELLVSRAEAEPQLPPPSEALEAGPSEGPERAASPQMALVPGRHAEPLAERPPPESAIADSARGDRRDELAPAQERGAEPPVHRPAQVLAQHDPPAEPDGAPGQPTSLVPPSLWATGPQEPGPAPAAKDAELATEQVNRDTGELGERPSLRRQEPAATAAVVAGPRRIGMGRATWY